jgi:hypothetical protein
VALYPTRIYCARVPARVSSATTDGSGSGGPRSRRRPWQATGAGARMIPSFAVATGGRPRSGPAVSRHLILTITQPPRGVVASGRHTSRDVRAPHGSGSSRQRGAGAHKRRLARFGTSFSSRETPRRRLALSGSGTNGREFRFPTFFRSMVWPPTYDRLHMHATIRTGVVVCVYPSSSGYRQVNKQILWL